MPEDAKESDSLQIGHVLNMDVVGYSELLITEQSRAIAELTQIVRGTNAFRRAESEHSFTRLPTGDGMALVFFGDPQAPIECAMEIATALKERPHIPLRIGIHSGPVNEVTDVNDRSNVAGAGIDMAQRVMSCGDAGHILLSKRVADDLAPFPRWHPHLHELGECEVKHGRKIALVNFYTDAVGNPERPAKLGPSAPVRTNKSPVIALVAVAVFLVLVAVTVLFLRRGGSALSLATSTTGKSIAVLPFDNLSHEADNAYFADGIQEEVLTRLSKIADLKVVSRTSTQRYKSAPENLREIGEQLGVAQILEGSVQKAGEMVRVNVQLINAQSDSHLWADKFDRKLTDIFAVESEIAGKIADVLQAKLTGVELRAIAARPTENSEAHDLYLRGRFYWNKWIGPDFDKSREYYEKALALDPSYALAYAGLADYYGFAFANGFFPPEEKWARLEEDNARKALALDPTLGEAYNPLAAAQLYWHRDWAAAQKDFQRGFELSPNFGEMHLHYAACLVLFGRNEEALAENRRALELDPLSARFIANQGRIYFYARRYDDAIAQYQKALEIDPNFLAAYEWAARAYEKKQLQNESITMRSKFLRLTGGSDEAALLERTYAQAGFESAMRLFGQSQLQRLREKTQRGEYVPAVDYLEACVQSGDKEQAFAWLAKAPAERNRLALEIKANPFFDPLRDDPRFDKIVKTIMPATGDSPDEQSKL